MKRLSLMSLILSMTVFGTIGVFRNYIPFPSAFLAMPRGFIGALFILLFLIIAIILSAVILDENMSVASTIGAVLILAFALMSELKLSPLRKKKKTLIFFKKAIDKHKIFCYNIYRYRAGVAQWQSS